jgi:type IV pilus assembly protein PilM
MSKLKDLFSRGKKSAEAGNGPGGLSKAKDSLPGGSRPSAEQSSRFKLPGKLSAGLSFLPSLKGIFASKKELVGLDIGSSSLKLAEILETKTGHILNHFSEISLDKGIIEDGVLIDPDALTEKIKALFKGTGLQKKAVVTSLSGHATIVKKVTLPTMEESGLRDLIHDEASKYLPFDNMNDVNYDFQILGQNEFNPNQMEVLLVAAKKDVIESFTEAIENAGLTVMIMDVDTFSMETAPVSPTLMS